MATPQLLGDTTVNGLGHISRSMDCFTSNFSKTVFVADSIWVALQIFEQFCPKAGDANPLVADPETHFYSKWAFRVIQGHTAKVAIDH